MPQPQEYERREDFTDRDGDDTNHAALNDELDAAALSINQLRDNLALIQRDDGALRNGIVTADSLADSAFDAVLGKVAGVAAEANAAADRSTLFATQAEAERQAAEAAKNAAQASQTAAANSATAASNSQTAAANSASAAATSATNSANSATASASSAAASATSATNSANSATASQTARTGSETARDAAIAARDAAQSSQTAAANSATAAAGSATAAASSANAAAASLDDFDDRYLGAKTVEPTVDNDGNPLLTGALYFNLVASEMRVYNGSTWAKVGSSVNGTSARFRYIATAGQTTFTGVDSNGNTLAYDAGFVDVYLNGLRLDPSDYTATTTTSIVLATAASAGDELNIVAFGTFELLNLNAGQVAATDGAGGSLFSTVAGFITRLMSSVGSALIGFIQAGAGAVQRSVQSKLRESVSVKDFGAVGDGVTDDTAAIQAAINSMPAAGGTVFFPNGTYLVNSGIALKTRVTIEGGDRNNTTIKAGAAGITVLGLSGSAYNVRIRHLAVDGNNLAAKGIAILGTSNGSNAHHVIEDVLVSGCTTNNIHLKFIIYGRLVNVYSSHGSPAAPTTSVLLEDMLNTIYEQCVFYNGTTSTVHVLRGSENYFHKTTVYNDVAYPATQLVLIDSGHGNKFEACTFESQGTGNVTNSVSIQDTTTGNCSDHSFIGCRFIGLPATKQRDIAIGVSGAVYKTLIRDCQFIKPSAGETILLTSQAATEISGCVDLVTYDTPTYTNVSVLNNSGNSYFITPRIASTANLITNYVQGTWTPALVAGTSGTITLTSPTNSMSYTRIGNRVFISGQVSVTSVSSPVGDLALTGLPFASVNTNSGRTGVAVFATGLLTTSAHTAVMGSITLNSSQINIRGYNNGSLVATMANNIQAGSVLQISATYEAV